MQKIKITAILLVFGIVGIILNTSQQFSSSAKNDDVIQEILSYKNWTKINEKPIKVSSGFQIDNLSGAG